MTDIRSIINDMRETVKDVEVKGWLRERITAWADALEKNIEGR